MKLISQEQQLNNFISKQTFCTVVHNNNIYRNNYESKVLYIIHQSNTTKTCKICFWQKYKTHKAHMKYKSHFPPPGTV